MRKLLLALITLTILIRSNAYAWTCWANINPDGTITQGTLYCDGIELNLFLETYLCVDGSYYQSDPYCTGYQATPTCTNTVEYQTIACSQPNTIGVVNQSRDYYCESDTYGPWVTTSENCSPAPATCIETSESRGVTCQDGYEGTVTQVRSYQCSDPYGQGQWTDWIDSSNTCVQTLTNPMNLTSPISPVSPIGIMPSTSQSGPTTEVSTSVISTPIDNVTAPESVQTLTTTMPDLVEPPKAVSTETQSSSSDKKEEKKETSTTSSSGTESRQESKPKEEQKEEKKSESKQEVKVPAGKELVPGFGLTMSLDILNNGLELQQIQLNDILNLVQEQEYGQQQNFLLDFITQDAIGINLDGIAAARWRSLLYDNPLQQDAFGN